MINDGPRGSAVHCSLSESLCEVSLGRGLFIWVDKVEEGLSDELICLIIEMVGEDRAQVDEVQIGGQQGPVWWTNLKD